MILFSLILIFLLLRTADATTSGKLIQIEDLSITQLLATHYDCSKQCNLRQVSLTRVQKSTRAPAEIE